MQITIIAGSNRKESSSTKLCRYIERQLTSMGCRVVLFDLYRQPLPLYSPDADYGDDANVSALKQAASEANAFVLSTPEYHGSVSGVLKNALDFLGGEHFNGKAVLSVSSSGGAVGTSSLLHLQAMVRNVHGINCPEWISIGGDNRKFLPDGEPQNPNIKERVLHALRYFVEMAGKLSQR